MSCQAMDLAVYVESYFFHPSSHSIQPLSPISLPVVPLIFPAAHVSDLHHLFGRTTKNDVPSSQPA